MSKLNHVCSPWGTSYQTRSGYKFEWMNFPQRAGVLWSQAVGPREGFITCGIIVNTPRIFAVFNIPRWTSVGCCERIRISKFYSRGSTQRLDRYKPTPTLVPGHSNFPIHPWEHRSITVREAATITGFPLDYKFIGSHTSRCMQVGNAVPVQLSNAIAKRVLKILE